MSSVSGPFFILLSTLHSASPFAWPNTEVMWANLRRDIDMNVQFQLKKLGVPIDGLNVDRQGHNNSPTGKRISCIDSRISELTFCDVFDPLTGEDKRSRITFEDK